MPSATAHRALPFPEGVDVPDVPLWLEALADALDFDLFVIDDDPRPAAGTLGRVHLLAGVLSFDTGVAWLTLTLGGPYLPTAGGALTGDLDLGGNDLVGAVVNEDRQKITTVAAAGAARTLDAAVSPIFDVTLDQDVTFAFSGVDGDRFSLLLHQPGALKAVVWPATVDWEDGSAPTQTAATAVLYDFLRVNGRWRGIVRKNLSAGRSQSKTKSADESITSSSALQADDELFLPIDASGDYEFEAALYVACGNTVPDFKVTFVVPAGATLVFVVEQSGDTDSSMEYILSGSGAWNTGSGTAVAVPLAHPDHLVRIRGSVRNGVNAGNLALQWAQNVSNANSVTVKAGSSLHTIKEG